MVGGWGDGLGGGYTNNHYHSSLSWVELSCIELRVDQQKYVDETIMIFLKKVHPCNNVFDFWYIFLQTLTNKFAIEKTNFQKLIWKVKFRQKIVQCHDEQLKFHWAWQSSSTACKYN